MMVNISVILPCKNEEKTIGLCIKKIKKAFKNKEYEIIVSDSSTDKSAQIAKKLGAIVVKHKEGYGDAYLCGIAAAKGDIIIMGDSDNTYDFLEAPKLVKKLNEGYDFVIGSRFNGVIHKEAMSLLHKFGNHMLSSIFSLFFMKKISDTHSGFRVIKKSCFEKLDLKTKGMEFASEMIAKAIQNNLKITEVPINYYPRVGKSKLRSFNDGWKHLRFMLIYSPDYLFLIPGMIFFMTGMIFLILLLLTPILLFGLRLDIHPMFLASIFVLLGYQILFIWLFAKTFKFTFLKENSKFLSRFYNLFNLEKSLILGSCISLTGISICFYILMKWINSDFGNLNTLKLGIFAMTFVVLGVQTIFSSFMLSLLGVER